METPITIDDLGVPLFLETPISFPSTSVCLKKTHHIQPLKGAFFEAKTPDVPSKPRLHDFSHK